VLHAARISIPDALAAVNFILQRQNDDGGFGSYEARRGGLWLGAYNPAEIYGNCMLELSYTECTASCIKGLAVAIAALGNAVPEALRRQVVAAIERGRDLLLTAQDANGGWAGFWGVHFTYGTYFAVHGLRAAGVDAKHPAILRAVRLLLAHQRDDGGWAEHARGLLDDRESWIDADATQHGPSSAVQTAWAVLTLQSARPHGPIEAAHERAITRGLAFLAARQRADGTWPTEPATGVFFNTAVLEYRLYRQIFPFWALSRELARR
jgi:lanosterol synthase